MVKDMNNLNSIEQLDVCPSLYNPSLMYKIHLSDHKPVFMRISRSNYRNDERFVVWVSSDNFLDLWKANRRGSRNLISRGSVEDWKNDYKYFRAEEGFKGGFNNPVPLARVACSLVSYPKYRGKWIFKRQVDQEHVMQAGVCDGATRTIWLLSHGAQAFPVECSSYKSAVNLYKYAAVNGSSLLSVDDLIPEKYGNASYFFFGANIPQ